MLVCAPSKWKALLFPFSEVTLRKWEKKSYRVALQLGKRFPIGLPLGLAVLLHLWILMRIAGVSVHLPVLRVGRSLAMPRIG